MPSASTPKPTPVEAAEAVAENDRSSSWRPLTPGFFNAPPEQVARALLGKILLRGPGQMAARIVETEAYLGEHDPAAHAASGCTPRNRVLYGPPGHAYVYSIYGMHFCLNVSCLPPGNPGCVLFRALEPLHGLPQMRRNRGLAAHASPCLLASGPGKLCQALGITRANANGADMTDPRSPLRLVEDEFPSGEVRISPRIGIRKAVDLPLRFFLAGNPCVSNRGR